MSISRNGSFPSHSTSEEIILKVQSNLAKTHISGISNLFHNNIYNP